MRFLLKQVFFTAATLFRNFRNTPQVQSRNFIEAEVPFSVAEPFRRANRRRRSILTLLKQNKTYINIRKHQKSGCCEKGLFAIKIKKKNNNNKVHVNFKAGCPHFPFKLKWDVWRWRVPCSWQIRVK